MLYLWYELRGWALQHWHLWGTLPFPSRQAIWNEPYEPSGCIWLCPTNAICFGGTSRLRNQCRPCGRLCSGWHQLLICLFAFCFSCLSCIRGRFAWLPVYSPQVIWGSMKRKQLQPVDTGSFTAFVPGRPVWICGCRPWSTRLCICSKM